MKREELPILEYDDDKNAVIRPIHIFKQMDIAKRCVVCNFGEAIEKVLGEYPHRLVTYFEGEEIIATTAPTAFRVSMWMKNPVIAHLIVGNYARGNPPLEKQKLTNCSINERIHKV